LGVAAWLFIGMVGAAAIILAGMSAVSSVVLPLVFAAVLAVLFRPLAAMLEERGLKPMLAAGAVVLGLVVVSIVVVSLTVEGIVSQTDRIIEEVEAGLAELDVDDEAIADIREALEQLTPVVTFGVLKVIVSGISAIGGFAVGALLGALIMYYLVKDWDRLRRSILQRVQPDHSQPLEPAITGRTLRIHPLAVLLVTTAGGIIGGLVGLVLAVPLAVIAVRAVGYLREVVDLDTAALRETLRRTVDVSDTPPSSAT
jgi:predicted PurR-regulated permease PerM